MIINNKENNKESRGAYSSNEHPVSFSPLLESFAPSAHTTPSERVAADAFSAVILAAGDFPSHVLPLRILRITKNLIVCDGALKDLLEYEIEPTAVVGDGDSLSEELKQRYAHIYHQISEQEFNDLTKATLFARSHLTMNASTQTRPCFCYVGATGKREDHTLGNISLMLYYFRQLALNPVMVTDYGYFVVASGTTRFECFPGQQVSIFNATCKEMSSSGLKWDVYPLTELWQGTLNKALSNEFTIQADGDYLVYRTHKI